jgi:hypothetical protein
MPRCASPKSCGPRTSEPLSLRIVAHSVAFSIEGNLRAHVQLMRWSIFSAPHDVAMVCSNGPRAWDDSSVIWTKFHPMFDHRRYRPRLLVSGHLRPVHRLGRRFWKNCFTGMVRLISASPWTDTPRETRSTPSRCTTPEVRPLAEAVLDPLVVIAARPVRSVDDHALREPLGTEPLIPLEHHLLFHQRLIRERGERRTSTDALATFDRSTALRLVVSDFSLEKAPVDDGPDAPQRHDQAHRADAGAYPCLGLGECRLCCDSGRLCLCPA